VFVFLFGVVFEFVIFVAFVVATDLHHSYLHCSLDGCLIIDVFVCLAIEFLS
jgi:hypothetical protein